MTPEPAGGFSDDGFFGERLRLLQPLKGHRVGADAALLAAASRERIAEGGRVADLGAGCGAVGLTLALLGASHVTLVEIDAAMAAVAGENARRNALAERTEIVCADVATLAKAGGPERPSAGRFDLVVANPPFDDSSRFRASPEASKALAHQSGPELVALWMRAAARLLRPGGAVVMIHRPQALQSLLDAAAGPFGDVRIRPIHPKADAPAARILFAAAKERRGALALLPPLVLHQPDGRATPEAEAAMRGEAAISLR